MSVAATMLVYFLYYLLGIVNYALLISAILSWVAPDAEGWLVNLIYAITEPFLLPVRKLLAKKNLNSAGPLDLSFFLTVMLILIIRACRHLFTDFCRLPQVLQIRSYRKYGERNTTSCLLRTNLKTGSSQNP